MNGRIGNLTDTICWQIEAVESHRDPDGASSAARQRAPSIGREAWEGIGDMGSRIGPLLQEPYMIP